MSGGKRIAMWWDRSNTVYNPDTDEERPEDPAQQIIKQSRSLLASECEERLTLADAALCLYYGNDRHSLRGTIAGDHAIAAEVGGNVDPPGYNVVQACVDTKTSHIIRNKVLPMFVTEAGDPELQENARGMQRGVQAIFDQLGLYGQEGAAVCRDGNLFDGGFFKFTLDYTNERITGDRVYAHDLLIPPREAKLGKPRQIGYRWRGPRDSLINMFRDDPDAVEAVQEAPQSYAESEDLADSSEGFISDMVEAYEWWHLPSGRVDLDAPRSFGLDEEGEFDPDLDPEHDGRHVICIASGSTGYTLLDEPWPYDYYPIAKFLPLKNPEGWWSRGIPETLAGEQLAITRMCQRVDGIMNLHATARLIIDRRAKLSKSKITNSWGDILESSVPPSQAVFMFNPNSVPADFLNQIDKLIAWSEKKVGLSELSIAAQKPAGIEHAPALQHLADEQQIRHTDAYRAWEQFHLDGARIIVDLLRLLATRNKSYEIIFGDAKDLKRIKWSKVDLGANMYHLKIWASNLLPQTPAAKISRIMDMLAAQLISAGEARALMDFPDTEAVLGDANAEEMNIQHKLDAATRGDTAEATPHAYLNLELAMSMAKQRINRLEADGAKPEVWDRVAQFWEMCNEMNLKAQADAAAAAQGIQPGGGAPAPGGGGPGPAGALPAPAPAPMPMPGVAA